MNNKLKSFLIMVLAIILFVFTIVIDNIENEVALELNENYIDIKNDSYDENNNDKLVALNGKIDINNETLKDNDFGVSVKSPILERHVEIFLWVEKEKTENGQTTYTYKKEWVSEMINSNKFHFNSRYENPTNVDYLSKNYYANEVTVGIFNLSKDEIDKLNSKVELKLDKVNTKKLPKGYKVSDKYITNSKNIDSPSVGDIRISYTYSNDTDVSVLAKQSNNDLVPYITKNKKSVDIVLSGTYDGEYMVNAFRKNNYVRNNILITLSLIFATISIVMTMKNKEPIQQR